MPLRDHVDELLDGDVVAIERDVSTFVSDLCQCLREIHLKARPLGMACNLGHCDAKKKRPVIALSHLSSRLPLESWGRRLMTRAEAWADRSRLRRYAYEFLWFGLKQGWACLFGGAMLALILGTFLFWPDQAPLAR